MSDFSKCRECGEYDWVKKHKCPPVFYFKHDSWGEELQKIYAHSFEDAALRFAKKFNEDGDYSLMDDGKEEVIISDGVTEKIFIVRAETSIEYYADEKAGKKDGIHNLGSE